MDCPLVVLSLPKIPGTYSVINNSFVKWTLTVCAFAEGQ